MKLSEVLDSKANFEVGIKTRTKFGTKTVIAGQEYVFIASVNDDWEWEIAFGDMENGERRSRPSGKGNEFEVGAFVKASLEEFMRQYNPIFVSFTADSPVRQKIYTRMMAKVMPGWKYREEDAGKAGKRFIYSKEKRK